MAVKMSSMLFLSHGVTWSFQWLFMLFCELAKASELPKLLPFDFPSLVQVNEKTSAACMLKQGTPPIAFKWFMNQHQLSESKVIKITNQAEFSVLSIESVDANHSGNYTCIASNAYGKDSFSASLKIQAPPQWLLEPKDIQVIEGERTALQCVAKGMPIPKTTWKKMKNDYDLPESKNLGSVVINSENGTLLFSSILQHQGGKYVCEADNGVGKVIKKAVTLVVYEYKCCYITFAALLLTTGITAKGSPPKIQTLSITESLTVGGNAKLVCVIATGREPFSFRWLKNGTEISNDKSVDITTTKDVSVLVMKDLKGSSSGNYTCLAKNSYGGDSYSALVIVKAPPNWQQEPTDREAHIGSSAAIDCAATGYPSPQITWKKTKGASRGNNLDIASNGSLIFYFLNADDEGDYRCEAYNGVGEKIVKTITLSVLGKPEIQFNFPSRLSEGASAKVLCNLLRGETPVRFKWLKDGETLEPEFGNKKITVHEDFSMLTVDGITARDSGNYTCTVTNTAGTVSHTAQLVIQAPARWLLAPKDVTEIRGSKVSVTCAAAGHPLPKITWTREGKSLAEDERVMISESGTLSIHILMAHHEGYYMCSAENGVGPPLQKKIKISVNVPARFDEKFTVVTVKKGDSASLRCEAIGDQPLTVIWRKDTRELRKINGGRYEIFETLTPKGLKSELVLREADRADGQLYTCLTENPYGKDERNMKLLVLEVPATPLDLKVQEVWSRSASVTWSPPYTGNSPITKYVIQYWRDAVSGGKHRLEEKIVTSAQTSALIKDLNPGMSYGMAIVAENTVGRGEPSDMVTFNTGEEEPAGAPMDVNVEVKGAASLLATWKPPPKSEWNGKLKGFYVGYRIMHEGNQPYSFKTVDYSPGGIHEHMVTSLRKDTEYSVIVKAFNAAGSGPPSQEISIRTLGGDLPPAPVVFVVATSDNSIKIQWRSPDPKTSVTGHAIHYRKKSESWQRVAITSPTENSYTLTGLQGASLYQLYVTAKSNYGEGDPSDMVTVKTYGHEKVVLVAGSNEAPFALDMSLLIPVAASLLAVTVVIVAVCIWVLKAKSRRNLERAIQEDKRYIYAAAASQRYVDIDKTRSLPAYNDPGMINFPTPYATVPMGDDVSEGGKDDSQQEMKSFLPQNMKDRPLPKPGSIKKRESHIYDSPQ